MWERRAKELNLTISTGFIVKEFANSKSHTEDFQKADSFWQFWAGRTKPGLRDSPSGHDSGTYQGFLIIGEGVTAMKRTKSLLQIISGLHYIKTTWYCSCL